MKTISLKFAYYNKIGKRISRQIQPNNTVVFVSFEENRSIEYMLDKLEQAHMEFHKAAFEVKLLKEKLSKNEH